MHLYEDAGFRIPETESQPPIEVVDFQHRYSGKSRGGVFADLPPSVIDEMSLGLIARLAAGPKKLTPAVIHDIAERVWNSLRPQDHTDAPPE